MKVIITVFVIVTLVGCATPRPNWVRVNTSPAQAAQDLRECDYDAKKATVGIRNGFEAGWQEAALSMQCMEVRRYRRM